LVGPLPWLGTHNSLPWGIKIMSFKNALLRPNAQNEFRIKLSNTQSNENWIIIDKVICHYRLGLRVF
jgi:hypothetical protein